MLGFSRDEMERIGCEYMVFQGKIVLDQQRRDQGAPRVAKVTNGIFLKTKNKREMFWILGFESQI